MNTRIEEAYLQGAKSSLQKVAGLNSEILGTAINPLNWMGGSQLGGALGVLMSKGLKRKKEIDENALWKNLLIPGYGPYHLGTRYRSALTDD